MDSKGKRAGKGALIQEELAMTLGVTQDQYLFQPIGNYRADGIIGGGVAFNILSDHENRTTDMTNIVIQEIISIDRAAFNQGENAKYDFSISGGGEELDNEYIVRRLTPLECERLQGFPDGWTDIGTWVDSKGKKRECVDSARYKALGNSIALPFWFWLLRRISAQYERPATLGSLFDGIGGFPLCWERCNGCGTALWASEIEEFPIAVTKAHFDVD